ncbi:MULTISPECIES: TetR/AcrR family transcriptional regulator [Metabacillus]|uniref:TetR family transcriptional regulator n=3 Tax=Metabacillus TaxID=2675233 RepID=A0A179T5J6_9BACI|nr:MULTISPECIES: TetR/AcrR family transcriptional regulator [Metabacillus]OAS89316.1 TetR family transcriptional regulator [Metabacillus litoralis]QNF28830.1 WHG domain-containing protein [Metabacillus sp. KUDC1714]
MAPRIGLNLQTILQTATQIANEEGVEAITLATLAKKLSVRPPSLYNHIDGLTGLRRKLAIHGMDDLYSKLTQAAIGRSKDEAVHAIADAYVAFVRDQPGLYEITISTSALEDTEIQLAGQRIVDLTIQVLNGYGLEENAALHAVRGLRSILHGFSSLEQKGGFGLPLDLDISLHLLIDSFLAGIDKMKKDS